MLNRLHIKKLSYRPATYLIAAILAIITSGCSTPTKTVDNPFEIDVQEFARIYRAVSDELQDRGYILDNQAYRFGQLSTKPRGSGSIIEFWRGDNLTVEQAIESTFNDQRRIVKIMIDPKASGGAAENIEEQPESYQLRVEVIVERRRVTTRHLSGSTAGWGVFANLSDVPREWQQRGIEEEYWQPVGRDQLLEQKLIAAIVRRSFSTISG